MVLYNQKGKIFHVIFLLFPRTFPRSRAGSLMTIKRFILDGWKYNTIEIGMIHQLPIFIQ